MCKCTCAAFECCCSTYPKILKQAIDLFIRPIEKQMLFNAALANKGLDMSSYVSCVHKMCEVQVASKIQPSACLGATNGTGHKNSWSAHLH